MTPVQMQALRCTILESLLALTRGGNPKPEPEPLRVAAVSPRLEAIVREPAPAPVNEQD